MRICHRSLLRCRELPLAHLLPDLCPPSRGGSPELSGCYIFRTRLMCPAPAFLSISALPGLCDRRAFAASPRRTAPVFCDGLCLCLAEFAGTGLLDGLVVFELPVSLTGIPEHGRACEVGTIPLGISLVSLYICISYNLVHQQHHLNLTSRGKPC